MLKFLHIFIILGVVTAGPVGPAVAAVTLDGAVARLGDGWATLKYQTGKDPGKLAKVRALKEEAVRLSEEFPDAPALFYWRAQILCLEAEIMHSGGSLDRMRDARRMLETAERLDPGSSRVKSLMGSIYYEVPGWPLSFGSDKKAAKYLREALVLDPEGMDPNYFMGDFLLGDGHAVDALIYLEKAEQVSGKAAPSRVVAGRRQEIAEAIAKARRSLEKDRR
jgi:cytochrome c-type biogenesis protein CcmH/NrfG